METTTHTTKNKSKSAKPAKRVKAAKASTRKQPTKATAKSAVAKPAKRKRGTKESYTRVPEIWQARLLKQTEKLAEKWEHFGRHADRHDDAKAAEIGAAMGRQIKTLVASN